MPESDPFRRAVLASKCVLVFTLPFLAFGFGNEALALITTAARFSARTQLFLIGVITFIPAWFFARRYARRPFEFICTLEHEVTHAIVGLPFLLIPRRMRVSAFAGGHVEQVWHGPRWLIPLYGPGRILSLLAPYFLPTVAYLMIALSFLFELAVRPWFGVPLGFLTTFHVVSTWAETNYRQPDIRNAGVIFSTVFIPISNLMAFGAVVAFAVAGPASFMHFWSLGFRQSVTAGWQVTSLLLALISG